MQLYKKNIKNIFIVLIILIPLITACGNVPLSEANKFSPNQAPHIINFYYDDTQLDAPLIIEPGTTVEIRCEAYDPEGKELQFDFTANNIVNTQNYTGSFSNEGTDGSNGWVTFTVGQILGGQDVIVTVTITDHKGEVVTQDLNLGTSETGPTITVDENFQDGTVITMGADSKFTIPFQSSMNGNYQVQVLEADFSCIAEINS